MYNGPKDINVITCVCICSQQLYCVTYFNKHRRVPSLVEWTGAEATKGPHARWLLSLLAPRLFGIWKLREGR